MIYDAFLFFNELSLLEIRLHELDPIVDKFVLMESTKTFSSKEKPLYYHENRERFAQFADKIMHVVVDDTPELPPTSGKNHNRHAVERWQRGCLDRGLVGCQPDDIVVVSDVDEIYRPQDVERAVQLLDKQKIVGMKQRFFYYYLNGLCVQDGTPAPWWGPAVCRFRDYTDAQTVRDDRGKSQSEWVDWAGWHFSFLGGADSIATKIEAFAHQEWDNDYIKDRKRLEERIASGADLFERRGRPNQVYVPLDDSFPKHVLANRDKFAHLVRKP